MKRSEADLKKWLADVQYAWKQDRCVSLISNENKLRNFLTFLRDLQLTIRSIKDLTEVVSALPSIGQVLGHIAWVPTFFVHKHLATLIVQCLLLLTVKQPKNSIEHRSTEWAWEQIHRLLNLSRSLHEFRHPADKALNKETFIDDGMTHCQDLGFRVDPYLKHMAKNKLVAVGNFFERFTLKHTLATKQILDLQKTAYPLLHSTFNNEMVEVFVKMHQNFPNCPELENNTVQSVVACEGHLSLRSLAQFYEVFPSKFKDLFFDYLLAKTNTQSSKPLPTEVTMREIKESTWFGCCVESSCLLLVLLNSLSCIVQRTEERYVFLLDCILFCLGSVNSKEVRAVLEAYI